MRYIIEYFMKSVFDEVKYPKHFVQTPLENIHYV